MGLGHSERLLAFSADQRATLHLRVLVLAREKINPRAEWSLPIRSLCMLAKSLACYQTRGSGYGHLQRRHAVRTKRYSRSST